jgi:hypothetical protein
VHPLFQMGRPSENGRRYLGQAQAIWPCRDFLLSDLATCWIADGNLRAVAVGVFPERSRFGSAEVHPTDAGIDRRVFRFTCIAELCNG